MESEKPKIDKEKRKAEQASVFKRLIRKKRQRDADQLLKALLSEEKSQELLSGFKHNQFGGFCLQASDIEKSETHLMKAYDIICQKWNIPSSNILMNIGNLHGQKKDYKKAIQYYEKVLATSPHNPDNKTELSQKCPFDIKKYAQIIYSSKLNSENCYIDAHSNMSVMYIQEDDIQKAFKLCQKALQLQPDNHESVVNFTDILRQLGKKQEAIKLTWEQIIEYTKKNQDENYSGFIPLKIKSYTPDPQIKDQVKEVNVLSVKWGTRYPASYVNKLYKSILRNTTYSIKFYCFTENSEDLHPDIIVMPLQEGWKKWWGKVTLFKDHGIKGRKFYIDLDMIITGNLDELFSYKGMFGTLRTGDLACEKNHKDGYNSSVMIWNEDILVPIYEALKQNFKSINKFIVRFDFWLQMTIQNADYLQAIYPGQIIDFLKDAKQTLPENSRVVCFARKPKPEDYPAEWVKEHWIQ